MAVQRKTGIAFAALLSIGVADLCLINFALAPRLAEELSADRLSARVGDPSCTEPLCAQAKPSASPRTRPAAVIDPPKTASAADSAVAVASPAADSAVAVGAPAVDSAVTSAADAAVKAPIKVAVAPTKVPPPQTLPAPITLHFPTNGAALDGRAALSLRRVVRLLKRRRELKLRVRGHADRRGEEAFNLKLSRSRAKAAARYLIGEGVTVGRMLVEAVGSREPADAGETPEALQKSRRVQLIWLR